MIRKSVAFFAAMLLFTQLSFATAPVVITDINNNPVSPINGIPPDATSVVVTSGNVAAAVAAATIPAVAAKTNYLEGFDVTGTGSTAGQVVVVTITGLLGGTVTYNMASATGVLVQDTPLSIRFIRPLPASAVNTAIVVSCASLGAGSTNNVTTAFGYVK